MVDVFKKYTPMEFQKEFNLFKIHISPYSNLTKIDTTHYFHYTSFQSPNNEIFFFATLRQNNETNDPNKYLLSDIQLLGVGNSTEKICFDFLDDGIAGKELKCIHKKWFLYQKGENKRTFLFNKMNSNLKIYLQQNESNKVVIEQLEKIQKTLDTKDGSRNDDGNSDEDDEGEGDFV